MSTLKGDERDRRELDRIAWNLPEPFRLPVGIPPNENWPFPEDTAMREDDREDNRGLEPAA